MIIKIVCLAVYILQNSCRKLLRICFPSKIYTLIRHCVDKQWETRLFSETHSCLQIFKKNKIYKRNTAPFTASLFTLFHLISMKLNITTNSIADGSSNFDIKRFVQKTISEVNAYLKIQVHPRQVWYCNFRSKLVSLVDKTHCIFRFFISFKLVVDIVFNLFPTLS
jgi:hypothetical protein